MNIWKTGRRALMIAGITALLSACQVVPKAPPVVTGPAPDTMPSADVLPTDETRHRVALLVPMSGESGPVGQSIANATTMALLDTSADNLRITTYDTSTGAREAARKAVADGNKLILGPLAGTDVTQVLAESRPAKIPLIAFSNDPALAGPDVFVLGSIPDQSIERTVAYARQRGSARFAAVIPNGEYGRRAEAGLRAALAASGGELVAIESYDRGNTSIVSAAQRLRQKGGFDTVLIADSARLAALAAGELKPRGTGPTQLIGTELLSGDASVTKNTALRGSWFSAVSDTRFKRFSDSYTQRFGGAPYRISTVGYDAVLLTLRVARDWKVGRAFPVSQLRDEGGFLGLDGAFRFRPNGVVERALEVREVRNGEVVIITPAPDRFGN
jgi:branched-chain amino acid transport system substrate-binding protein